MDPVSLSDLSAPISEYSLSAMSIPLMGADKLELADNRDSQPEEVPEGWTTCIHPQGWIYFFNASNKIVTDQDIRTPEIHASITRDMDNQKFDLKETMEIHFFAQGHRIGVMEQVPTNFCLFVDHARCIAFFEDELEAMSDHDHSFDPIRLNRRARLYWNYLWNHPVHVPTPARALTDALDALTWFYTDNLISGHRSTVPFSKSECEDLLRIVHQLSAPAYGHAPAKTVFLAWILRESYKFRDAEHHGQYTGKDFQLYQDSRLPPPDPLPSLSFWGSVIQFIIIRCVFFGIPNTYHLHVKITSEYRGRLASVQNNWEHYVERLVREYSHFLLIATVLLSATIGFLSAPGLPEGSVITAIVSALISLGSIITGVFSIWTHQAKTQKGNFFTYLHNARHSYFGFLGHAIMLSLPPVLLVWSILAFTLSLVVYAMQGIRDADLLNRLSAWTILGVFVVLFIVVISALYTFSMVWKFRQRTHSIFRRVKDVWVRGSSVV